MPWEFITKAFELAHEAKHLAIGPVEHLLVHHGEKWISNIEHESSINENFAWMITGVWQIETTEGVGARIKKIQDKYGQVRYSNIL